MIARAAHYSRNVKREGLLRRGEERYSNRNSFEDPNTGM